MTPQGDPAETSRPARSENARVHPVERRFQALLWGSRRGVLLAVVCCAVLAFVAFGLGAVDTIQAVVGLVSYAGIGTSVPAEGSSRAAVVAGMLKAVDAFLIGAILLVVALGLYELFVSRITAAEGDEMAPQVLLIRNLDDLKTRVARLILLVLIVEFFGQALKLPVANPQELVLLSLGVFLIGGTLYLMDRGH